MRQTEETEGSGENTLPCYRFVWWPWWSVGNVVVPSQDKALVFQIILPVDAGRADCNPSVCMDEGKVT